MQILRLCLIGHSENTRLCRDGKIFADQKYRPLTQRFGFTMAVFHRNKDLSKSTKPSTLEQKVQEVFQATVIRTGTDQPHPNLLCIRQILGLLTQGIKREGYKNVDRIGFQKNITGLV